MMKPLNAAAAVIGYAVVLGLAGHIGWIYWRGDGLGRSFGSTALQSRQ